MCKLEHNAQVLSHSFVPRVHNIAFLPNHYATAIRAVKLLQYVIAISFLYTLYTPFKTNVYKEYK